MSLQFVPADKVGVKDDTCCQTLNQLIGVHFSDLNPNSYDMNNMKFNYMSQPRPNLNDQGLSLKTRINNYRFLLEFLFCIS